MTLAGLVALTSAFWQPRHDHLRLLLESVPVGVPRAAAAFTALVGLGLLVLARGLRRGQRRAWTAAFVLLLAAGILHLARGVDYAEATLSFAVAGVLWTRRGDFKARADTPLLVVGVGTWAALAAVALAAGTAGLKTGPIVRNLVGGRHRPDRFSISWGRAAQATAERMVGIDRVPLPRHLAELFDPVAVTVGIGLGAILLLVLFRPARSRQPSDPVRAAAMARARALVARYGCDTLDYFALRDDKQLFFWGDTLVAYAVYGGVCLVSPDPVGPIAEREAAWAAFRGFVDDHGWVLAVLGADSARLALYEATGMHHVYVGDEAVVDVRRFSLAGGRAKSLRQAVNRVARHGYQVSFHDPARLDPGLRRALGELLGRSRRGDAERGFSMTLGRVFDPDDQGLLLSVVHAPPEPGADAGQPGRPVAFCQYTPIPQADSYSLDLMRRDRGDHPNGLIDFALVETIHHLRDHHVGFLSLNFATMRAVLAGEAGSGPLRRLEGWLLRRLSRSMQIESLWKFNAKFTPEWQPRYALYDAPEDAPAVALAVARAESWWEVPIAGRFLRPAGPHVRPGQRPLLTLDEAVTAVRGLTVAIGRRRVKRLGPADTPILQRRWLRAALGGPGTAVLGASAVSVWLLTHFDLLDGVSLEQGWFVPTLVSLVVAGVCLGSVGRGRRWWATWGVGLALASAVVVALVAWWLRYSGLVVEHYPPSFLAWAWAGLWALGAALTGWWSGHSAVRLARILTAPLALLAAFCLIDAHYGYWPTLGVLLDRPAVGQFSRKAFQRRVEEPVQAGAIIPAVGRYGPVTIPASGAGFDPATAYLWVPPDFDRIDHADLPVIMMLPGSPGGAQDWVRAGQVLDVANRWARAHGGQAPVMVFVDENGAHRDDTECVNGPQGYAETYLTQTVPEYLERTYGIDPAPQRWAVAGFSEGGTCALGLAIEHPNLFGRFVDLAGDDAPNYGTDQPAAITLFRLYGGSTAAEAAHDPLTVLATHRYTDSEGWLSSGLEDYRHVTVVKTLAPAAQSAGIQIHTLLIPGGHSWIYASHAFADIYPSLLGSLGEATAPTDPAHSCCAGLGSRRTQPDGRRRWSSRDASRPVPA